MSADVYGSRPDLLPSAIRDAVRSQAPGVSILSSEENEILERRSLGRFSLSGGSALSWNGIASVGRVLYADEAAGAREVEGILLGGRISRGDLVVFCDNLIVPSVRMPFDFARNCLVEMFETYPGFWIFDIDGDVLIDCRVDGNIFYGSIPDR